MGIWDKVVDKGYELIIKEAEKKELETKQLREEERKMRNPLYNEFAGEVLNEYEEKHLAAIREHLAECMVLLKSNGDFPLSEPCKIAAYGHGVRNTIKGGTGSGEVNSRFSVNVEQGLTKAGFEITTGDWLDTYDEVLEMSRKRFIGYIKEKARIEKTNVISAGMGAVMPEPEYRKMKLKNPLRISYDGDVAIYVLSRICGEGNDRRLIKGDYKLNDSEVKDILRCNKKYSKFMLVINSGGPVDLSPVMEVPNILVMSQLGVEGGPALADVLLGKVSPSGKLTASWLTSAQTVIFPFGEKDDTVYEEGVFVGYRYFDRFLDEDGKAPLFCFGHGLSYTTFDISEISVFAKKGGTTKVGDTKITLACTVKNTGKYNGREVVQIYVSAPNGEENRLDKPYQVLAAFVKSKELKPGEKVKVYASFRLRDVASFDEINNCWLLESGEYVIRVGNSSRNTVVAERMHLDESITIPIKKNEHCDAVAVNPYVSRMTDEELALMCIGAFDPKGGIANVIGSAGVHVAGAAGETCTRLSGKNIKSLVMADGPAGIRIARDYFKDKKGQVHAIGSVIPGFVADFLPNMIVKAVDSMGAKPEKDQPVLHQYATALPIATAIAQSWNVDFAQKCGDVVGAEMELLGIQLWLAPALNIQRNVLCGRNFEYYSEDPLISGLFAAAVTKGVQKHPGCGVTIKHYLANNQEFNRYCNNSVVSERALREIYLKGFEICIRESQPFALMTSYNLVNAVHTSESRRFTTGILRGEFGFKGIIMTDWIAGGSMLSAKDSRYGQPEAWKVIAAGSELFMPGGKRDYKNLLKAIKSGKISRRRVEKNVSRLWNAVNSL